MIKVDVESYCQDCEEFEPRSYTAVCHSFDKDGDVHFAGHYSRKGEIITSVYCRYREKCRSAVARAKEIIEEEQKEANNVN